MALIDTYYLTLLVIEEICGKNLLIKEKTLIKELHTGIKHLWSKKSIPFLHSCLKETIQTALERYEQKGFIKVRAFANKKGSSTTYLQSFID